MVVKPAEQTSLTALRLGELALEAGVPPGGMNVVTGMGPDVGEPLGWHIDVDALTVTGSTEMRRLFLGYSAQSNLKEVCLEMGEISTPFGGHKASGFRGRDNGIHAHDQYTELKTIWFDLSV